MNTVQESSNTYDWEWVERASSKKLHKKMEHKAETVLSGLLAGFQSAAPANRASLAFKVLRSMPEKTVKSDAGKRFIKALDKTGIFNPLNTAGQNSIHHLLDYAIGHGQQELAAKIIKRSHRIDPCLFIRSCRFGLTKIMEAFFDQGALPDCSVANGETPLLQVARLNRLDVMAVLLRHGADVNAKNGEGATPLHLAARLGSIESMRLLIDNGADVNSTDIHHETPLHKVQLNEKAKLLIEHGADVEAISNQGRTPLHLACQHNRPSLAMILFEMGAQVIPKDAHGLTPLDYAIQSNMNAFVAAVFSGFGYIQGLLDEKEHLGSFIDDLAEDVEFLMDPEWLEEGANPLEVPLLLQSPRLANSMILRLTESRFQLLAARLDEKYPPAGTSFIKDCMQAIHPEHLRKGMEEDIPPSPRVRLSRLKKIFNEINFSHPELPGYYNPARLKDDGERTSVEVVKQGLSELVERVKFRRPHVGTPPEGSAQLPVFYDQLEKLMKHVTKAIKQMDDPLERAGMVIDLGVAGLHCGIRWISDVHQMYRTVSRAEPFTFEDRILSTLRYLRATILTSMVSGSNPHQYNLYISLVGQELGIEGAEALGGYNDIFAMNNITAEELKGRFYRIYTPSLILDYIKEEMQRLYKKFDTRDLVVDWFKDNMPQDWLSEKFKPIKRKVAAMSQRKHGKQDIEVYLKRHHIYCSEGITPFAAIENCRRLNYLYEHVFEKDPDGEPADRISRDAITYMLLKMGVFQKVGFAEENDRASCRPAKRQKSEVIKTN